MRDEVDQLALEPVRVLELVDHDHAEPQPRRLADVVVVAEEVAGCELEILEVDDRLASLRGRVLDAEALEQLLQQVAIVRRELLERRPLGCLARPLERRRARPLHANAERSTSRSGGDPSVATRTTSLAFRRLRRTSPTGRPRAAAASARNASTALSTLGRSPSSRTSVATRRAERLVDAREHAPQARRRGRSRAAAAAPAPPVAQNSCERALERLAAEHGSTRVLELAEARIEARGERMRAQERDCRTRGWSRSTRRRARGRGPGGRARAAPRGSGSEAHLQPCACT